MLLVATFLNEFHFFQYEGSFKVGVGVSERVGGDHSFALLTINSFLI